MNKVSPWLSRPVLRNLLSQAGTVSFHRLLDRRPDCIVLVSLAADTLFGDAHLIGSLVTSALVSAVMRPERRDRKGNEVCFYLDECEHFDGLSEQMSAILSEGRKFGMCACLSHQVSIQLNPKLRNLIRNVVGTQILFAVGGGEAETLAGEIASDEPKAVVRNLLMNQKVGECTVVRRGQPCTRIRTRHSPDPDVSEGSVEALRLSALRTFGRPKAEIEADLAARDAALAGTVAQQTKPAGRAAKKVPQASAHTENDSTGDTRLEVREADDTITQPKPGRRQRKKAEPS